MDNLLEISRDEQIENIIELIKNMPSNDERKMYIISLPDDLKMKLINRIEDIYVESEIVQGNREARRDEYEYFLVDSMSEENIIEFFKEKNNRRYIICFLQYTTKKDDMKLKLFELDFDFSYKLLIVETIEDKELRTSKLKELNVPEIFICYTEEMPGYSLEGDVQNFNDEYGPIGISRKLTFGIEIESVNTEYAEALKQRSNLFNILEKWVCKGDYTIEEGNEHPKGIKFGLEVVSPILRDEKKTEKQLTAVCDMLQKLGTVINEKCGGHIHYGIDYFETPKELWNLIEIYGSCDEIFMLMSNEAGTLPRNSLKQYAESTYQLLKDNNINIEDFDNIEDFIQKIKELQAGKNYDVNISDKGTVEFRVANSSIKSEILLKNIQLHGKLIEIAKVLEEKSTERCDKKQRLYSQLKETTNIIDKSELLLELLFDDEKDREHFRNRFITNKSLQIGIEQYRVLYSAQELKLNLDNSKNTEGQDLITE